MFPGSKDCLYPGDVGLEEVGTRTIFPLCRDSCLIITHLQLVRDPWLAPRRRRTNARAYQPTIARFTDFQFGRELEEDEVLRINLILKRRATRYIAAAREEWLYPEELASTTHWSKIDQDWFLLPNPYKVKFSTMVTVGYKGGGSWTIDEYGRHPRHPEFDRRDGEWDRHLEARLAWALKRDGRSIARVAEQGLSNVDDAIMKDEVARHHRERAVRRRTDPRVGRGR